MPGTGPAQPPCKDCNLTYYKRMDSVPSRLDEAELLPHRSFGYRLWMLRHAWTRRLEAVLQATDLTHMQFFLLRATEHVASLGEVPSQSRLADAMHIDRMTASKVLRNLEAKGLLVRAVHPDDPRANSVALTDAGGVLLRRATLLAVTEQDRFFGRLGAARKAEFSAMLDELLTDGCRAAAPKEIK